MMMWGRILDDSPTQQACQVVELEQSNVSQLFGQLEKLAVKYLLKKGMDCNGGFFGSKRFFMCLGIYKRIIKGNEICWSMMVSTNRWKRCGHYYNRRGEKCQRGINLLIVDLQLLDNLSQGLEHGHHDNNHLFLKLLLLFCKLLFLQCKISMKSWFYHCQFGSSLAMLGTQEVTKSG